MTPCAPARPAAGPAIEKVGSARRLPHYHGPSRSFDANANLNLQSTWYQLAPQTRDQPQATLGTPGPPYPSRLLRTEQPWHKMPQASKRVHNNDSIDRIGEGSGNTSMDQYLHTPERGHTPSEENEERPPTDKKRKRLPYRCK